MVDLNIPYLWMQLLITFVTTTMHIDDFPRVPTIIKTDNDTLKPASVARSANSSTRLRRGFTRHSFGNCFLKRVPATHQFPITRRYVDTRPGVGCTWLVFARRPRATLTDGRVRDPGKRQTYGVPDPRLIDRRRCRRCRRVR